MQTFQKTVLSNGVRVLTESSDSFQSAAIGIWCSTGSIYELPKEAGISHFIEHMMFKGTSKRTSREIAESIEGRGGDLNAFTGKELTCYYCRLLADDVPHGIEVLSNMVTDSLFAAADIDLERGVILEEILRSIDEPSSYVHDLHIEGRWQGHQLGKPVIGTSDSVGQIQRDDFLGYIKRRYQGNRLILSVAGACDHQKVVDLAQKLLGNIPSGTADEKLAPPKDCIKQEHTSREVEAVHFCVGTRGLVAGDPRRYVLALLDLGLGGNMSSRLFQEIREKRGLVYAVGSYSLSYESGGLFTIYGGTGVKNWPQVLDLVWQELKKVAQNGFAADELARLKKNLSGSIILRLEGLSPRMNRMVNNEITFGRYIAVPEILESIEKVSQSDIQELARELFEGQDLSVTTIGPSQD